MGYSHSWIRPRELDRDRFVAAAADCRRVCESTGVSLRGIEGHNEPLFEEFIVAFDGGCEWFIVQCVCGDRTPERPCRDQTGKNYGFCKTDHLPYDICVQGCLIVFQHHFGTDFAVSSDGDSTAWDIARQLCQRVVGYGTSFPLTE